MIIKKSTENNNIFFRSFINNGLNTIFTFFFGILSSVLFTRIFGIELFGEFTLIASYITIFFSLSTIGILSGFKRESIWFVANNKNIGGYISLVYIFLVSLSVIFVLPLWIFNNFFFDLLNLSIDIINPLIFYFIAHIIIYVPATIFLNVFESYQDIFPITYINFFANLFKVLAILVFAYLSINIYTGIFVYFIVPNFIIIILAFYKLLKLYDLKFDLKTIKASSIRLFNSIKFTLKLFPLMISELIMGNLAILLLGKYGQLSDVGEFRILFSFYLVINFIPVFFSKLLNPMITKFFFNKEYDKILKYYNISFKTSMFISTPIIVVLGYFTSELLLMYGIESQYLVTCMWILLLTNFCMMGSSLGSVFSAYDRPELISLFLISGAIFNLLLSYLLIPIYGILGACIAILISNIVIQLSMHFYSIIKMKFLIALIPIIQVIFNGSIILFFLYITATFDSSIIVKIGVSLTALSFFIIISIINNIFSKSDIDSFNNIVSQFTNKRLRLFLLKIISLFHQFAKAKY